MSAWSSKLPEPVIDPNVLPLTGANALERWKNRRQASRDDIDKRKPDWDKNLERYLAKTKTSAAKDEVIVPKDYANTEQKKGQLFFQTPYIQALPLEPNAAGLEEPISVFEPVINHYLGPDGDNAKSMVDEVLMDALVASGIFASKIAYESIQDGTKPVQVGQQPDPNFVPPPMMDPMQPPPQAPMVPVMQDAPNIISEKYIWERISPAKLLVPVEFTGSDYDKSPWLGFDFLMDFEPAKRAFNLPDDFNAFAGDDDHLLGKDKNTGDQRGAPKRVKGSEIWYKASLFDETVKNPDLLRVLVIIDGVDAPVKHKDSPYQIVQEDGSIIGMPGFPIHVGALRYVPDSAFPPSDCQMSRVQVEELSGGRTQMVRNRKRSVPMRYAPIGLGTEFFSKIEKNIDQGVIPIADEHFMSYGPEGPIREVNRAQFPKENFSFDQIANRDISETWALDATQRGVSQEHSVTATEIERTQQNANIRLSRERTTFLTWFARGTTKLAALIQQFADQTQYVAIVGEDGARRLQPWDKTKIQGRYLFACRPDSSIMVDAAANEKRALDRFNLLHGSPFINQQELLAETLRDMGKDPAKLIAQPQPKPVEVPKVSFTFNDQSLNPANPAFPIVMEILRMGGIPVDDKAIGAAQKLADATGLPTASAVSHGNPSAPAPAQTLGAGGGGTVEPMNKHLADKTGQRSGPPIAGQAA